MGLFQDILDRSKPTWQPTPDDNAAFPELTPTEPATPEDGPGWLKSAMKIAAEKKKADDRNKAIPAVDEAAPAVQMAMGAQPESSIPAAFQSAGMLPSLNPNTPIGRTDTEKAMQPNGPMPPAVPMPQPAPAGAKQPLDISTTDIAGGMTPGMKAPGSSETTDISSNGTGKPLQIAPAAAPAAPEASPFELPSILNRIRTTLGDNSNTLLAIGAGFAGAPNIGQGISRAAAAAIPARAADIAQRTQLSSQYGLQQALLDAGVPKQQAFAAVGNPKLADALIQSYVTDRGKEIIKLKSKDSLGNEIETPYIQDKYAKDGDILKPAFKDADGNARSAPGDAAASSGDYMKMPLSVDPKTGRDEQFLDAFRKADPINAAGTEAVLRGDMPANSRNLQQLMKFAARIDPSFQNATYPARQSLYKSYFGDGLGAKQLLSANTATDHGVLLADAIKKLNNFSMLPGFMNPVTGAISEQYNKPYQRALKEFETNKAIFAHELEFATTGKNTVSGTNEFKKVFDKYAPPDANFGALDRSLRLLGERINEREQSFKTQMGHSASNPFAGSMFSHRDELEAILKNGAENYQRPEGRGIGGAGTAPVASGKTSNGIPWSVN